MAKCQLYIYPIQETIFRIFIVFVCITFPCKLKKEQPLENGKYRELVNAQLDRLTLPI